MIFLYNIFLKLYLVAIHASSFFGNKKAKLWIDGRRNPIDPFVNLKSDDERIWVHCSSLGEFEQGRPVIEKLKQENSKVKIILTFFSPSGYEVRKNYSGADCICYLPLDSKANAKEFIEKVNPSKVFFVKYDYWFYFLAELHSREIPVYFISSIFRKSQRFFKWYGSFFRKMLSFVTHFFVQDDESGRLLQSIGYGNFTISGDTRFDRVLQVAATSKEIALMKEFVVDAKVLVAGSTWPQDETLLFNTDLQFFNYKLVLVPHEVNEQRILAIVNQFERKYKTIRYSKATQQSMRDAQVLVLDNIGMLSSLYKYGTIAWIGGGFGKGIHNTLEAAVYGIPVTFGTKYHKFAEAVGLISRGGAFCINSPLELNELLKKFKDDSAQYEKVCNTSRSFVQESAGATQKIVTALNLK